MKIYVRHTTLWFKPDLGQSSITAKNYAQKYRMYLRGISINDNIAGNLLAHHGEASGIVFNHKKWAIQASREFKQISFGWLDEQDRYKWV